MKISFCMFTFNQEKYVTAAVEAAFAQTYEPLEIIIVDDGSGDRTADIVRSMVEKYKGPHRVKTCLKEENRGLADSVNKAIYDLALGDWLVFAAGDDISKPDRCSEIAEFVAARESITTIQGGAEIVGEDLKPIGKRRPLRNDVNDLHRLTVCGAAASYKRDAVVGFPRIGQKVRNEDFVLTSRAILTGRQAELQTQNVIWRRHEHNLTAILSETGPEFGSIAFSMLQQIADIGFLAGRGQIGEHTALRAIGRIHRRICRIKEKEKFHRAKTSLPSLLRYVLSSPVFFLREAASIAYSKTFVKLKSKRTS